MHPIALIQIWLSTYHKYSSLQLVRGYEPNISHLRVFGCAVYVPIAPPQCAKMDPHRRLDIYVSYEYPLILKYLKPLTGNLFTTHFAGCDFDEAHFPTLDGRKDTFQY